jgi:PTH1 family peptidyl-tRNA hydrolase
MFLIVGLGNPGKQYARTRHNAGWFVLDELARRFGSETWKKQHEALTASILIDEKRVLLAKPQTFMNLSGRATSALMRYGRIERSNILIISDDLNLPLGRLRLRVAGSDGGHNGLKSVTQMLGSSDYARLRFGVGEPPREDRRERGTADHVLSAFAGDEWPLVEEATQRGADCVETFVAQGVEAAMNRFNAVAATNANATNANATNANATNANATNARISETDGQGEVR